MEWLGDRPASAGHFRGRRRAIAGGGLVGVVHGPRGDRVARDGDLLDSVLAVKQVVWHAEGMEKRHRIDLLSRDRLSLTPYSVLVSL